MSKPEKQYGFVYVGDEELFRQIIGKPEGLITNRENTVLSMYQWTLNLPGFAMSGADFSVEKLEEKILDQETHGFPILGCYTPPGNKMEIVDPLPKTVTYLFPYDLPLHGDIPEENFKEWENEISFRLFVYSKDCPDTPVTIEDVYKVFSTMERLPEDDLLEGYAFWFPGSGRSMVSRFISDLSAELQGIVLGVLSVSEIATLNEYSHQEAEKLVERLKNDYVIKGSYLQPRDYPELWELLYVLHEKGKM